MAEALVQYETIDDDQIQDIMAGKTPRASGEPGKRKRRTRKKADPSVEASSNTQDDTPLKPALDQE